MSRNCDSGCAHSLELEFINDKYRDMMTSNIKLRDQLREREQPRDIKYIKLCEELTKVRTCSVKISLRWKSFTGKLRWKFD